MAQSGQTIVYTKGGDVYLGNMKDKKLNAWILYGRDKQQKWMYKGYRNFGGVTDSVVVFDTQKWSASEISTRKTNGFLGIREYDIKGKVIMMQ